MLYNVCKIDDIKNNSMMLFKINHNGTLLDIVVGKINQKYFACNNYCPHMGASLSKSELVPENNRIICYLHDFEYDLFSGKLMKIPEQWQSQNHQWKKSGDLILYSVIENNDGSLSIEIT